MDSAPPASLSALLPGSPLTFRKAAGTVYLWEPAPRIAISCVVGALSVDGAEAIELAIRRVVSKHGRVLGFHDWEGMTDYETAARTKLVATGLDVMKQTDAVHVLTKSNLVQLAVRAASVVVRTIRMHSDRSSFEALLQKALIEAKSK